MSPVLNGDGTRLSADELPITRQAFPSRSKTRVERISPPANRRANSGVRCKVYRKTDRCFILTDSQFCDNVSKEPLEVVFLENTVWLIADMAMLQDNAETHLAEAGERRGHAYDFAGG